MTDKGLPRDDGIESNKRVYSVQEVMDMLNISSTTPYNLIRKNVFHSVKIGSHIRISKKSFDEWLRAQL